MKGGRSLSIEPLGVTVELLEEVDHMGIVYKPKGLEAIIKSFSLKRPS